MTYVIAEYTMRYEAVSTGEGFGPLARVMRYQDSGSQMPWAVFARAMQTQVGSLEEIRQ